MKTYIALIAALAASTAPAAASGSTQLAEVASILVSRGSGGYARITLDGTGVNPDSCSSGVTSKYYLDFTHPQFESIMAMALTARATQTPIQFLVNGCFTAGATSYPSIWYAEM